MGNLKQLFDQTKGETKSRCVKVRSLLLRASLVVLDLELMRCCYSDRTVCPV